MLARRPTRRHTEEPPEDAPVSGTTPGWADGVKLVATAIAAFAILSSGVGSIYVLGARMDQYEKQGVALKADVEKNKEAAHTLIPAVDNLTKATNRFVTVLDRLAKENQEDHKELRSKADQAHRSLWRAITGNRASSVGDP